MINGRIRGCESANFVQAKVEDRVKIVLNLLKKMEVFDIKR